jgi:hypothetical protein
MTGIGGYRLRVQRALVSASATGSAATDDFATDCCSAQTQHGGRMVNPWLRPPPGRLAATEKHELTPEKPNAFSQSLSKASEYNHRLRHH